jgi:GNAT superfamily N-acetyltransferase
MEPIVRTWKRQDLPAIKNLLDELAETTQDRALSFRVDYLQELYDYMAGLPEVYLNLVVDYEGEIAGFLSLIFYKTLFHGGGTALLNELVVGRDHRNRGLGRMLIERARREASSRGMQELEVSTEIDNVQAREFYLQCGFKEEHRLLGMEFEENAM